MVNKVIQIDPRDSKGYHETTLMLPMILLVASLLLIGVPLGVLGYRIDEVGGRGLDLFKYKALEKTVSADMQAVKFILNADNKESVIIDSSIKNKLITLVIPEVVIVEQVSKASGTKTPSLEVDLGGIYWNPNTPLATIDGETRQVGDQVQGYEVVWIGKTKVRFRGQDGSFVEKGMYDDLLQEK